MPLCLLKGVCCRVCTHTPQPHGETRKLKCALWLLPILGATVLFKLLFTSISLTQYEQSTLRTFIKDFFAQRHVCILPMSYLSAYCVCDIVCFYCILGLLFIFTCILVVFYQSSNLGCHTEINACLVHNVSRQACMFCLCPRLQAPRRLRDAMKYTRGLKVAQTSKIHSDILPNPSLNVTGDQQVWKFASNFDTSLKGQAFDALQLQNRETYQIFLSWATIIELH